MLKIFLAVAHLFEYKGLSCLSFLKFQPLAKVVAYKPLLIKQNKCKLEMVKGEGKNYLKLKILPFFKSTHQKFHENALSKSNFSKEEIESP